MIMRALLLFVAVAVVIQWASVPVLAVETNSSPAEIILDETTFHVDGTRGRLSRRFIVQINAPEGRSYGVMVLGYDSFRSIRSFTGRITDANGRRIKRLRSNDIMDRPGSDGFSLYTDYRRQVAELYHDTYPYRVEWEYEVRYETLLNWPSWYPQRERDPVREATLTVDVPADFDLRYQSQWLDLEPQIVNRRDRRLLTWSATSLPGQPREPLGPDARAQVPAVHFAASEFRIGRWSGSMASWQGFGRWYDALWSGHLDLPADAREEVQQLVAGVDDPRERARLVYQLVQRRTRYVSVQLGIGGWQPFDATYVHTRRYGDCKALTNYLQALLREVGIDSYPALIGAGRSDLDPEFPRNGFNHVVLFVPLIGGEPIWLEATNSHLPFGQLGPETEGRYALVVTPQSGQLMRTPISAAQQNVENRFVNATLQPDGSVGMQIITSYTGHAVASLRTRLVEFSADQRGRLWRNMFGLSNATIHNTNAEGLDITEENLSLSVNLTAHGYAVSAGRRLFLNPNMTQPTLHVPPAMTTVRRQPVEVFRYSYTDVDTVRIALPEGVTVEVPLDDVSIEMEGFGSYSATLEVDGNTLIYVRRLAIYEPQRPAEDYHRVREFLHAVAQADDRQVALVVGG